MADIEVPVLVVGGSLVGMSTAMLLGRQGISTFVAEHHRGTAIHPRAAQILQRTMEILRTVGVEQLVMQKSEEQFTQDGAIMAVETLAGKELTWFFRNLNDGVRDVSPSIRLFITQNLLEPLLKARAEELGSQIHFGTEMMSFEEDTHGVTAQMRERDTGRTFSVRAKYMVAADGAHSPIRERLGIRMRGHGVFSKCITIYFRGEMAPLLRGRNLSVIYVVNSVLSGFIRIEKPFQSGFLVVFWLGNPKNPVTDVSSGLTNEKCLEYLHAALGTRDVPLTIENVMHWDATADVAERFQHGRIFLAGDAAHVMPPTGGFGGNTGVQDAHNLAWKLALVLKGAADPRLLASYEAERLPASAFTVEQAYSRYVTRSAPFLGTDHIQPIVDDLNIDLGYCYHSAAVVADDEDKVHLHDNPRETRGRPGTRAPHLFLERNGRQISTLDLFGGNFVLLAGPGRSAWCESGRIAGKTLGIPMDVHQIGADGLSDPSGNFASTYGMTPTGAVLVRPDGFVAWRARSGESATPATLARVLATLLCREVSFRS